MAFLIEAEGKRVLYSGDLRLHGRKPGMAKQLLEAASQQQIHALVMEGTHVGPDSESGVTEWNLETELVGHIQGALGIVLANFSPLNVDRLVGFYRATIRTGRTFVVDPYAAMVMQKASQHCDIPDPAEANNIRVYFNHTFTTTWEQKHLGGLRDSLWDRRIAMDELRTAPKQFVMVFRPSMVALDFDGALPAHVRCIYSYWSGYLSKPHWVDFQSQLAAAQGDFIKAHTSGHIFAHDIADFVQKLDPQHSMRIIPIHTFHPEGFPILVNRVENVEDGQQYTVA